MEHIWVPEQKISSLLDKFNTLARRAAKNGLAVPRCDVTKDTRIDRVNLDMPDDFKTGLYYRPKALDIKMVKVEIEGRMPVFNGWKFLASIEHNTSRIDDRFLKENQPRNYINATAWLDDREIQVIESQREFLQDCPANCEHCDLPRNRNQTFLLENTETQEQKQVGSSCIDDFLGHDSLKKALWFFELDDILHHNHLNDYVNNVFLSSSGQYPIPTELVVAMASLQIDAEGFVSRGDSNNMDVPSTSDRVRNAFSNPTDMHKSLIDAYVNDQPHKQLDKAREVREFYLSLDSSGKQFIQSAKTLLASDFVNLRQGSNIGVLSFLPEGHRKELAKKTEIANTLNEHFGAEKQRGALKLKAVNIYENYLAKFPYALYTLKDDDGRTFTWKTSSALDAFDKGKTYTMKASIKDHDVYKGVKQTVLTRVADIEEVSPDTAPPDFQKAKKSPKKDHSPESEISGPGM